AWRVNCTCHGYSQRTRTEHWFRGVGPLLSGLSDDHLCLPTLGFHKRFSTSRAAADISNHSLRSVVSGWHRQAAKEPTDGQSYGLELVEDDRLVIALMGCGIRQSMTHGFGNPLYTGMFSRR